MDISNIQDLPNKVTEFKELLGKNKKKLCQFKVKSSVDKSSTKDQKILKSIISALETRLSTKLVGSSDKGMFALLFKLNGHPDTNKVLQKGPSPFTPSTFKKRAHIQVPTATPLGDPQVAVRVLDAQAGGKYKVDDGHNDDHNDDDGIRPVNCDR